LLLNETLAHTPREAKLLGHKYYFPGIECPYGHLSKRRVKGGRCVACDKRVNDARKQYIKDYHQSNKEQVRGHARKYKRDHAEKVRIAKAKYVADNPAKSRAQAARRRARLRNATPPWVDHDAIDKIYEEAVRLTELTGIPHEVDHIIPLAGKNCCGLHVHNNLQILTMSQNRKKHIKVVDASQA